MGHFRTFLNLTEASKSSSKTEKKDEKPYGRAKWPVMSLRDVLRWVDEAKAQGVSEVARGPSGFLTAFKRAGTWFSLSDYWKNRRDDFVSRHMAQVKQSNEKLWEDGKPTRRALALIMWAYYPPKN